MKRSKLILTLKWALIGATLTVSTVASVFIRDVSGCCFEESCLICQYCKTAATIEEMANVQNCTGQLLN